MLSVANAGPRTRHTSYQYTAEPSSATLLSDVGEPRVVSRDVNTNEAWVVTNRLFPKFYCAKRPPEGRALVVGVSVWRFWREHYDGTSPVPLKKSKRIYETLTAYRSGSGRMCPKSFGSSRGGPANEIEWSSPGSFLRPFPDDGRMPVVRPFFSTRVPVPTLLSTPSNR